WRLVILSLSIPAPVNTNLALKHNSLFGFVICSKAPFTGLCCFWRSTFTTEFHRILSLPCAIVDVAACLYWFFESTRTSKQGVSDRKSTRLNSSHVKISYAVFCLKKKKTIR